MRKATIATLLALAALLAVAGPAQAQFGINSFDVQFGEEGGPTAAAGTHPFAITTALGRDFDSETLIPGGWLKDIFVEQVPGLSGDTTAYRTCPTVQYLERTEGLDPACPLDTQVGVIGTSIDTPGVWETYPVFNLEPPPGALLRLGFRVFSENVFFDITLADHYPYNAIAASRNTPQLVNVFGAKLQLWGEPASPAHDELRGDCGDQHAFLEPGDIAGFHFQPTGELCPVDSNPKPFLTMPTNCSKPLQSTVRATSWEGESDTESSFTHDAGGGPQALAGCDELRFEPSISAQPTSRAAASPTGLDFGLKLKTEGLTSVGARAQSAVRRAVVTLPVGMTANPSVAEGLEVCSEADLDRETLFSKPGQGCPEAAKIGTIEVTTPQVDEPVDGTLYQATPHANLAGDSLIAFYIVLRNTNLGLIVKQPVRVEPDPRTGQLRAITDEIPQLPFGEFRLHFREGGRSPLVSPPTCGTHRAVAELTPWSGGPTVTSTSDFRIVSGPDEGPCPSGGTPPFEPGFGAGSENNAAAAYSPFSMRLLRRDGDQDLTRFDATLPPGVVARVAGVDKCADGQIALAKAKTGKAELASPSCPLSSQIGVVHAGAGVGSQLTYVTGHIYLAGSFGGAPLSAVAIVPAVAGPFDVGTVVYRQALRVDPRSALVTADGGLSDPLPHILAGVPLTVRDVQVSVDRLDFTLNPTSCDPFATQAKIWGGGADPFSALDDSPVGRSSRYQAASCQSLGFAPKLSLSLEGGTRRGDHPALHALLRPRAGDANIESTVVRLPRSAFLDQGHIRTICTRVQYAAKACPPGAVYGHVRATTPLLSEPLQGPAYLRSSNHKLPDLVFALHGLVDFEAVARVDSVRGGIRVSFTGIPDAPIGHVTVDMLSGAKGLIVNSRNLCAGRNRADLVLEAHNAKRIAPSPVVKPSCRGGSRGGGRHRG